MQQKRQRSNYLWSRVHSDEASIEDAAILPKLFSPSTPGGRRKRDAEACIPIVKASLPCDDTASQRSSSLRLPPQSKTGALSATVAAQPKSVTLEPPRSPHVNPSSRRTQLSTNHGSQPRTYHLSTNLASSLRHVAQTCGVLKPRKHRNDVAVFVEKTKRNPRAWDALSKVAKAGGGSVLADGDSQQNDQDYKSEGKGHPVNVVSDRKDINCSIKPGHVTNSQLTPEKVIEDPANRGGPDSMILPEQSQQTAVKDSSVYIQNLHVHHRSHPKIKPKPSRPRLQGRRAASVDFSEDEIMGNTDILEKEDNFVYDTFIRSSGQVASISMQLSEPNCNVFEHVDASKVGILIITEQDELVWETFGEEEESDKDWNSEEEDENGTCYIWIDIV